jgi:hypothetical protein
MRHQIPAFEVTPWTRRRGGSPASPHETVGQVVDSTSTSPRRPAPGDASAAATAGGRSAALADNTVVEGALPVMLEL